MGSSPRLLADALLAEHRARAEPLIGAHRSETKTRPREGREKCPKRSIMSQKGYERVWEDVPGHLEHEFLYLAGGDPLFPFTTLGGTF